LREKKQSLGGGAYTLTRISPRRGRTEANLSQGKDFLGEIYEKRDHQFIGKEKKVPLKRRFFLLE